MSVLRLRIAAAVIGMFVVAVIVVGAAGASSPASRTTLVGSRPSWVPAVTRAGTVQSGQHVDARVWLAPNNSAQLASLAKAVSDPSSLAYGQFLTTAQYDQQFAPTAAQVAAVSQWLTGAGLNIVNVGPDNHYVAVSRSADAINTAFGTQLALYQVNGTQQQAPSSDLSVPSALSGSVLAITGLAQFGHAAKPSDFGPPAAFVNATPCSSYYSQQPGIDAAAVPRPHPSVCRAADTSRRSSARPTGSGVASPSARTAASVSARARRSRSSTRTTQRRCSRTPTPTPRVTVTRSSGGSEFQNHSVPEDASTGDDCQGGNGWYGEQALDVEAVHGMAPNANVFYYGAASCFDDDLLARNGANRQRQRRLDRHQLVGRADVRHHRRRRRTPRSTPTWSRRTSPCSSRAPSRASGSVSRRVTRETSSRTPASSIRTAPAEDPWVTSVGGSSLAIDSSGHGRSRPVGGPPSGRLVNGAWVNTIGFQYGAGGGYVNEDYMNEAFGEPLLLEPWYQINAGISSPTGGRAVPDVGIDADPTTGMLIGETQDFPAPSVFGPAGVHYGEYRIGGTSLASPLFAGTEAVAQGTHRRIGFANPRIYSLANSGVFFDVTPQGDAGNVRSDYANGINASNGYVYSVRTFDQDSSLFTAPGWDDVTGLGSPTARSIAAMSH